MTWSGGPDARPSGRRYDSFRLRSESEDKLAELMSGKRRRDDGLKRGVLTPELRMEDLRRRIAEADDLMADMEAAGWEVPDDVRARRDGLVAEFVSIGLDGYLPEGE